MAAYVAMPSATMVLNMQYKEIHVFHEEVFQLPML